MDLGKFLGDIGRNVGKLFGGGRNEDEERKRRAAQNTSRPAVQNRFNPTNNSGPALGGSVQQYDASKDTRPTVQAPVLGGTKTKKPNLAEQIGAGFQQGAAQAADTALQGGLVIGSTLDKINPFLNDQQRQAREADQIKSTAAIRNKLFEQKDITGRNITGNEDVAEEASRIANGQGSVRDIATVGARGLDVANTATAFINPLRVASGAAAGIRPTIREVAPFVAKEAALFGGSNAAASGAATYGETGNVAESAKQAGIGFLTGAVPQIGLEGAALGARRALSGVQGNLPAPRSARELRAAEDAALMPPKPEVSTSMEQKPGAVSPGSPVTDSPTTNKAPAITSANPNWVPPQLQAPEPMLPQQPQLGAPQIETPQIEAPVAPQLPEIDPVAVRQAEIQQQLDEQTLAPQPVLDAPTAEVLEAPSVQQSRVIAQEASPISPDIIEQALAREVAQQAPSFSVPTLEVGGKMKFAKPSVSGSPKAVYGSDDPNLSQIARSAVIAAKGTAKTATEHIEALARAGFDAADIKAIRDYVVKNANKSTGQVDAAGLRQMIESRKAPATEATPPAKKKYNADGRDVTGDIERFGLAYTEVSRLSDAFIDAVDAGDLELANRIRNRIADLPTKNNGAVEVRIKKLDAYSSTKAPATEATPSQINYNDVPELAALDLDTPNVEPVSTGNNLGKIAQTAVQSGRTIDDAGWEALGREVGEAANQRAQAAGVDLESIFGKVQRANESRGKVKSAQDAGLSPEEFDIYKKTASELDYLRNRADPSLITGGTIDRFYLPRQSKDTEYTPDLVNEQARGTGSGRVDRNDLDLSTTPIEQYIRRYGNAENVVTQSALNAVESKTIKGAGGDEIIESGLKVSNEAKAKLAEGSKRYVEKKDSIERALANTDVSVKDIDKLTRDMDDDINATFRELINDIPKNTPEGKEAIARLTEQRGAYLQSTIRTNMFSNIVNRSMDQVQSTIIKSTNQMMGISDSLTSTVLGQNRALAKGRDARSVARQYAKGSLFKQIGRDFRANMQLAGDNPASKLDVGYRAAGTALTSAGDLTTTTVKTANLAMLARAQAEGITTRSGMEKYLRQNINSAEYKELLQGVQDAYAGYVSMPMSAGSKLGRTGNRLSKFDNAIANSEKLKELGVPPRIRREMNDLIMPALTGFAGATYRVGAKSLNAAALGVPGMYKGLKLAREGGESSRQIGQIMINRSLIDGVLGGTSAAATVGALAANNATWTGEYPSDPAERARWEKQGIQPNALSFDTGNGETLQVQPGRLLGALALPIVLPAVIKSGGSVGELVDATMGQMLENLGVDSALQNLGNISTALTGSGFQKEAAIKKLVNSAGFSTSALVPLSGALNNAANATDDVKRDTSGGPVDVVKNRIPGLRQTLDTKTDNLGAPIRNNVQNSLGSSVISTAKNGKAAEATDPLNDEINRLAGAKFEVLPGQDVENKNSTNDAKLLLDSTLYSSASDEKKAEYLNKVLKGTDTKDINSSLDADKRTALIQHKLLGEKERPKWLENNDNAAAYYGADYDNAKANGTLTSADDDLEEKSGKLYKSLRAQVNKETGAEASLQRLYDNVSEAEWRDMIDPESEDYDAETAQRLYDYDQARTAKGVSGKSSTSAKPKFTEKKAKGGGGGGKGGGKGSDNFSFASLPTSLIGAETSGSKYDKGERLFKPIPDLQAPTVAQIPKSRTISVKRGNQL